MKGGAMDADRSWKRWLVAIGMGLAVAATAGDGTAQLETRARQRSPALVGWNMAAFGGGFTAPGISLGLFEDQTVVQVPLPAGTLKNLRVYSRLPVGGVVQPSGQVSFVVFVNGQPTSLGCVVLLAGVCASSARVAIADADLMAIEVAHQVFSSPGVPAGNVYFSYSIEFE